LSSVTLSNNTKGRSEMRNVPWHVKDVRSPVREAPADATQARRAGLSVGAAFAMIRKEIQDLRRQTSRPQIEPAIFEQRLHELTGQIAALQGATTGGDGASPSQDVFLKQLRGLLAQNLANLEQQVATTAADAISGPAESIRRDVASLKEIQASVDRRTQDTFEAVYGTIERIVDRLAAIEEELRDRNSGPPADAPALPSDEAPSADDADRSGLPAIRAGLAPGATGLASPRAAADEAWRMLRQPAVVPNPAVDAAPGSQSMSTEEVEPDIRPPRPAAARDAGLAVAAHRAVRALMSRAASAVPAATLMGATAKSLRWQGKAAIAGVGAALLILLAVTLTLDLYSAPVDPTDPVPVARSGSEAGQAGDDQARAEPAPDQPPVHLGANLNLPPLSVGAAPAAVPAEPGTAAAPATDTTIRDLDVLMHSLLLPQAGPSPWPQSAPSTGSDPAATPLPPTIGSKALIAAAQAGDPGAAYEVAIRFTQGRNAGPDLAKAAVWLAHAAQAGLAPAQFRLASMYEKGLGVRKDVAEARRLYLAAVAKGHAKAMHNLAVLYTRGVNGAADYGAAIEWFRKAAAYGTIDSQYNLGILYARGTGVERDLVESYKWFTLAAKGGDKDAAHKRDEVAKALDPKQQESAKASADAFVAMPQPDEATTVKAPAGGWDQVAAATTKSRTPGRPERSPGK
jgi:localization factor PodJL